MKYLALPFGIVSALLCIVPALLLFIFGGICNWAMNLWSES